MKNEPASCQKASVCMAVMADTRSRATASVAFAEGVAPSAARPIDSGDSRITQSEIGSIPTSTPTAMST